MADELVCVPAGRGILPVSDGLHIEECNSRSDLSLHCFFFSSFFSNYAEAFGHDRTAPTWTRTKREKRDERMRCQPRLSPSRTPIPPVPLDFLHTASLHTTMHSPQKLAPFFAPSQCPHACHCIPSFIRSDAPSALFYLRHWCLPHRGGGTSSAEGNTSDPFPRGESSLMSAVEGCWVAGPRPLRRKSSLR